MLTQGAPSHPGRSKAELPYRATQDDIGTPRLLLPSPQIGDGFLLASVEAVAFGRHTTTMPPIRAITPGRAAIILGGRMLRLSLI